LEIEITHLEDSIASLPELAQIYNPRWLAIQLLENDEALLAEVKATAGGETVLSVLAESRKKLEACYGDEVDIILADQRYSFVNNLVHQVLTRPATARATLSDRIDQVVTHRWLGIPFFLALERAPSPRLWPKPAGSRCQQKTK
jgi:ferrous iron transport protein B